MKAIILISAFLISYAITLICNIPRMLQGSDFLKASWVALTIVWMICFIVGIVEILEILKFRNRKLDMERDYDD